MCDDDDVISTSTEKHVTHTVTITQEGLNEVMKMSYEWKRVMDMTPDGPPEWQLEIYRRFKLLQEEGAR
jgi:hypothetical protein